MDILSEIINQRSTSLIMVFDLTGQLLFCNREALKMRDALQKAREGTGSFIEAVCLLCKQLRRGTGTSEFVSGFAPGQLLSSGNPGTPYALRPFLLGHPGSGNFETHVLIMIERVIERHRVNVEKARREFHLTKREAEMVKLICEGFTNREIAENKFISQYTAKVPIKNIMKKMRAGSRNDVISLLQ